MRTQRIVESIVAFGQSGAFSLVARNAPNRIYLLLTTNPSGTTVSVSTLKNASTLSAIPIATGTNGILRWELIRETHGILVQSEWYMGTGGIPVNPNCTVLEVYEEETGPGTRFNNVRPPFGAARVDPAGVMEADRVTRLMESLRLERDRIKHATLTDFSLHS